MVLHEISPVTLMRHAIDTLWRMTKGVQGMAGDFLQASRRQRLECSSLSLRTALQTDSFAFWQGNEFVTVVRADISIGIAKNHPRHIKWAATETLRVATPGA